MAQPTITESNWMTDWGRRPDLEALNVNEPIGYIGNRIYPRTPSRFKNGMLSGLTLPQYAAAQTNRTDGNAPTTTLITNAEVSYETAEIIARFGKTAKQTMDTGNIYKVDEQGARGAIYSWMYTCEQKALIQLTTTIATTHDNLITASAGDNVRQLIFSALSAIHRYRGRRVLIAGAGMIQKLAECLDFRSFFDGMPFERRDSLLDGMERIVSAMQTIFLLDEVLVADDSIQNAAGNAYIMGDSTLVVAVIPQENEVTEDSFTYQAELGRCVVYQPYEGMKPYQVESFPDGNDMTNKYTAYGMVKHVELNPMMKRIIDLSSLTLPKYPTVITIDGGTANS